MNAHGAGGAVTSGRASAAEFGVVMRAWLLKQFGSLDNLELVDNLPAPQPGADEVLLKVELAALNPADRYLALAQYPAKPPLPHILGRDGVGVIAAVGSNVKNWRVGGQAMILRGEVGVNRAGTFAEMVAVPAELLTAIPTGWTHQEAACGTLVYLTAWQALTQWGDLPPSVVLVTGASGGVGVACVQLGRAMGHTLIGLSRSAEKSQRLRELGAAFTVNPEREDWAKDIRRYLGARKVDVIIDNIGGAGFSDAIDLLGQNGKASVVGRLAGPVPEFNTAKLFFRRIRIGGVAVDTYSAAEAHAAWDNVVAMMDRAQARPLVDSVFPLDQLPQAFERLHAGPLGKVLVVP